MTVTVKERRAAEMARLIAAVATVESELADYARSHGVRFVVFGSFARGDFVASSDLDLMVEGPEERLRPARDFAENACRRRDLPFDIYLAFEASERLMFRIRRDGRVVS